MSLNTSLKLSKRFWWTWTVNGHSLKICQTVWMPVKHEQSRFGLGVFENLPSSIESEWEPVLNRMTNFLSSSNKFWGIGT